MKRTTGLGLTLALGIGLAPHVIFGQSTSSTQATAREYLRSGQYVEAIDIYGDMVRDQPADALVRAFLMEALIATGRYEEAIRTGRDAPDPGAVAHLTGDALRASGRLDEAAQAYRQGATSETRWALTARVGLAELMFARGQVDEAMRRFDPEIPFRSKTYRWGPWCIVLN